MATRDDVRAVICAEDVDQAVAVSVAALTHGLDKDWSTLAAGLTWTCWHTAGHIAEDLVAYALQVAGQPRGRYVVLETAPEADAPVEALLEAITASGRLLAAVVRQAPADVLAFHPWGDADAEGFAAMGIVEVLLHTQDVSVALGLPFAPPAELCAAVTHRLFSQVSGAEDSGAEDSWALLLWATGRGDLPGRDRVTEWRWSPRRS